MAMLTAICRKCGKEIFYSHLYGRWIAMHSKDKCQHQPYQENN